VLDQPERQARRREQHREAMRRSRRRERDRVLMVTLPVTPEQTAKLSQLRYLRDCELEDRARIAEAISALIDHIEIG
jgi:hypothetical protein